jgi:mersacidin/lichenicidin family type 2 lantibiotic
MTTEQIVRSWKDEEYSVGLSEEEKALLPDNPAGLTEISDEELLGVEGGSDTAFVCLVTAAVSAIASAVATYYITTKIVKNN